MALLLVALLTMAAIVVDLGAARETRRRNQGGVDAAALGGAQDLPAKGAAITTVRTIAASNLGLSATQTDTALQSCLGGSADPSPLAVKDATYNCISFDFGAGKVRVYYPSTYRTAFGKVIGATSLSINNGATATKATAGEGGVLPFGLGGAGTGLVCLKEATAKPDPTCTGPTQGDFHMLNIAEYTLYPASISCSTGDQARLGNNIAIGIDHTLTNYPDSLADLEDATLGGCPTTPQSGPDDLGVLPGNKDSWLSAPLIDDAPGGTPPCTERDCKGARLQRGSFVCPSGATNTYTQGVTYTCQHAHGSSNIDDVPLWHFITPDAQLGVSPDIPTDCHQSVFNNELKADFALSLSGPATAADMDNYMANCFNEYTYGVKGGAPCQSTDTGCTDAPGCGTTPPPVPNPPPCRGVVFGLNSSHTDKPDLYDIQYTPRFGYAPVVCSSDSIVVGNPVPSPCPAPFTARSGSEFVVRSRAIFLQTLVDSSGPYDIHEPGVGFPNVTKTVNEVKSWAFPDTMLPNGLGNPGAPNNTDINQFISLVQ